MSFIAEFTPIMIVICFIAFTCEFMDASLGMGFGTTLTPVLLIIGYDAKFIVPAVLLSELFAGSIAVLFHSLFRNIKLGQKKIFRKRRRKKRPYRIPNSQIKSLSSSPPSNPRYRDAYFNLDNEIVLSEEEEYEEEIVIEDENDLNFHEDDEIEVIELKSRNLRDKIKNLTTDTKVVLILGAFGILGAIIAAILAVIFNSNPIFSIIVKSYIGVMVFSMGVMILSLRNKEIKFSMKRIIGLGALAGFNKGISGGGYGPITVSGQLLSGRESKNAIASTSFSETATCFVGVLAYIITNYVQSHRAGMNVEWEFLGLAPYLIAGAVLAAPLAALVTKKVHGKWLKIAIGWATIFLGIISLTRLILKETGIWDKMPIFIETFVITNGF